MANYKSYKLNHKREKPDNRDYFHHTHPAFKAEQKLTLAPSYDLSPWMPAVLDQMNLGSCVSNAVSNTLRYRMSKLGASFQPSRLFIYYNGRIIDGSPTNEDTGLTIRGACKSAAVYKYCSENWIGYDTSKFAIKPHPDAYKAALNRKNMIYSKVLQTETNLKTVLAAGNPIVFGMDVYESFMSDDVAKTGIVPMPKQNEQLLGSHCMVICGYNDKTKMFKIQNSWGLFGDDGYVYIPYAFIIDPNYCSDFWIIKIVV